VFVAEGALEGVVFDLVEAVHVELPDKAVHFVVAEVVRQDDLLEFQHILYDELQTIRRPVDDLLVVLHLNYNHYTPKI
jgi:hypothetical protein